MQTKRTESITEAVENLEKNNAGINSSKQNQNINPQVKAVPSKIVRRKFSTAEKLKIINAFDACADTAERGVFLRKERLYYSGITKWKTELREKSSVHANSKAYKAMLEHNKLQREVASLKKKLAQAEAIIEVQKKVSELLSINILDCDMSEMK